MQQTLPDCCVVPEPAPARAVPTVAWARADPPSHSLRSSASSDLRQPSREVMPVGDMWSGELPPLALSPRTAHPPRVRSLSPGHSRRTSGFIGDDDRSAFTPSPTIMLAGGSVSPVSSRRMPS